jgi:hypothetical protein
LKLGKINNNERLFNLGNVKEPFIVVASTADSKMYLELLGTNHRHLWDSCTGKKMNYGFDVEGTKYLRLCADDSRIVEKEELFWVKKVVASGMEIF